MAGAWVWVVAGAGRAAVLLRSLVAPEGPMAEPRLLPGGARAAGVGDPGRGHGGRLEDAAWRLGRCHPASFFGSPPLPKLSGDTLVFWRTEVVPGPPGELLQQPSRPRPAFPVRAPRVAPGSCGGSGSWWVRA